MLSYLLPWEFSITWTLASIIAIGLYLRGTQVRRHLGQRIGVWRLSMAIYSDPVAANKIDPPSIG